MIFWISKLIARMFGLDISVVQKRVLLAVMILGLIVVVVVFGLIYRACNRPPKLDEKAIQKAQTAIAKQDREEMVKILANSDAKETEIDSNIKAVEQAREDAKKNYTGLSNDQLAEELNRRSQQP